MPDLDLGEDSCEGLDERGEGGGEDDTVIGSEERAVDLQHAQERTEAPNVLKGKK